MSKEKAFRDYLVKAGYRLTTVNGYVNEALRFVRWAESEGIPSVKVNYENLLKYMNHEQAQGKKKSSINGSLNSIKHYYHYLQVIPNPAEALRMRNVSRTIPHELLEEEELHELYENYPDHSVKGKRDKAMLSLLIYQGLKTGELQALELTDVQLENGSIYIRSVGRSNSRTLKLEPFQIMQLQKYIMQIRPALLSITRKQTDRLFVSIGKGKHIYNSLSKLFPRVRTYNRKAKNYKQIRASVITGWLKHYNIRQVQYMAGHRYVSSTEHYQTATLESLQEEIEDKHPLNKQKE